METDKAELRCLLPHHRVAEMLRDIVWQIEEFPLARDEKQESWQRVKHLWQFA